MQKTPFPFPFRFSAISWLPPRAQGWSPAACPYSLVLRAAPKCHTFLRLGRIPFGALQLASSSNSPGKHLLAYEKPPFWEGVLSFIRQESLPLTGVPGGTQQAHGFFLAVNCNRTDNYAFAHVLDKSSFSHNIRLIVSSSCCLPKYSFKWHIETFPHSHNKIYAITRIQSSW